MNRKLEKLSKIKDKSVLPSLKSVCVTGEEEINLNEKKSFIPGSKYQDV